MVTFLRNHCVVAVKNYRWILTQQGRTLFSHTPPVFSMQSSPSTRILSRSIWQLRLSPNKKKDNISEDQNVAYVETNRQYLMCAYLTIIPVTGVTLINTSRNLTYAYQAGLANENQLGTLLFSSVLSVFLFACIWSVLSRSVLWMYYSDQSKKFTAVKCSAFLQKEIVEFSESDVKARKVSSPMFLIGGNCMILGKPTLLNQQSFKSSLYYNKIFQNLWTLCLLITLLVICFFLISWPALNFLISGDKNFQLKYR